MTNNKTSLLVSSQLPQFVNEDHPLFVEFVKLYYEWMEQDAGVTERAKNLRDYIDIDKSIDEFTGHLYDEFMKNFPNGLSGDKRLILKHIKEFYRSRGTEKSIAFLLRAAFGEEATFYYPKNDVLRTSDGKWYIERGIRVINVLRNGVPDTSTTKLDDFVQKRITGQTSKATAVVESVNSYFLLNKEVDELTISNIVGNFTDNEDIVAEFDDFSDQHFVLRATILGGQVSEIRVTNGGSKYKIGDPAPIISTDGSGNGAVAVVSSVSSGNVRSVAAIYSGAGFKTDDPLFISSDSGSGASGHVISVVPDGYYHPNSYNISADTIGDVANTNIGGTFLASANANTTIANALNYFAYSNVGPIQIIGVDNAGSGYLSVPQIDVQSNTIVRSLGILGRMEINNPGTGYANGDIIEIINDTGGFGFGAQGNVVVDANGSITYVRFTEVPGYPIGGLGYSQSLLPLANVRSNTGHSASIQVTAILGDGEQLSVGNTTLGAIQTITIVSGGSNYDAAPRIDLTANGDGLATAQTSVLQGVVTYPGRYLNDDGFLSSYNYLEDRDYYQDFSYVVRLQQSLDSFKKLLLSMVHPAGMRLFSQRLIQEDGQLYYYLESNTIETKLSVRAASTH